MVPAAGTAATKTPVPRRMICVMSPLGFDHSYFYPKEAGRFSTVTPYLEILKDFRHDVTVVSGTSHPEVNDGHASESSFLTGAPPSFARGLPQYHLARSDRRRTDRQPDAFSVPGHEPGRAFQPVLDAQRRDDPSGIQAVPGLRPIVLERFGRGGPAQVQKLRDGHSVMDAVLGQAKGMQNKLGPRDRQKLEQYFTSVREVEQQLVAGQEWARKPKPQVKSPPLKDVTNPVDLLGKVRVWYELIYLAVQTDSSRLFTLHAGGNNGVAPPIPGVKHGWHGLSHSLSIPENRAEIRLIETEFFKALRGLLAKLQGTQEGEKTLLDRSMVLFGSNLHDGNHGNRNLPMLLAGGGFEHGTHLAFDQNKNMPLCRLYVSMLQRLGLEVDNFSSGMGTMPGLKMK